MPGVNTLNPHPPEFERFLYAPVGEDRKGGVVTVLSALARLNIDPWTEAAELAALGRQAAAKRLGSVLSRLRDVPALEQTHDSMARDLTHLLPQGTPRPGSPALSGLTGFPISAGHVWAILGLLLVVLQIVISGASGMGGE